MHEIKKRLKLCVNWSKIDKKEYLAAMRQSTTDATAIKALLKGALTDKIDDREIFMKGIDYFYYYEQEDWLKLWQNNLTSYHRILRAR